MKAIFLGAKDKFDLVYADYIRSDLENYLDIDTNTILKKQDIIENKEKFLDTEIIFSTWGMPSFESEEIKEYLPNLKAVFYAAGSVQYFARPFLENNVKVFSAWAANAVPVAEYTVAQIVLANKGYFINQLLYKRGKHEKASKFFHSHCGNYKSKIGLIGAGMIGSMVAERLKEYNCSVLVFDPFLSDERAENLGVKKASLKEIFESCDVVSNHLANNEKTVGMLNKELFNIMKPYSTFINTGRGAQVVEQDLIDLCKQREDVTVLLDVTIDEPIKNDSKFYKLDNIFITTHIAGSSENETWRMAEYMENEFLLFKEGKDTNYEVTLKMLETMA